MRELISRKRAKQITQRMRSRTLGVAGDWMLDRYVWGAANKISPEAPVPVIEFAGQDDRLGGAGNVAANLAALGARVHAFGAVGKDEAGNLLLRRAHELRIESKGLINVSRRPTTLKTRIIAGHQQVVRIDSEIRTPLSAQAEELLARRIVSAVARLNALIISDYDKGVVSDSLVDRILKISVRRRVPVFIKPKWSRMTAYPGATLVICNRAEAGFLVTRPLNTEDEVEEAGRALLEHFGSEAVVITLGKQGLILFQRDEAKSFSVNAISRERPLGVAPGAKPRAASIGREVFDVTGAGDTVLAVMALAHAAGATIHEAVMLGNAAAGVVVSKLGTATLTINELLTVLGELSG